LNLVRFTDNIYRCCYDHRDIRNNQAQTDLDLSKETPRTTNASAYLDYGWNEDHYVVVNEDEDRMYKRYLVKCKCLLKPDKFNIQLWSRHNSKTGGLIYNPRICRLGSGTMAMGRAIRSSRR
jgi:hypothetical protein